MSATQEEAERLAPFTHRLGEVIAAQQVGHLDSHEAFIHMAETIKARDAVMFDIMANRVGELLHHDNHTIVTALVMAENLVRGGL